MNRHNEYSSSVVAKVVGLTENVVKIWSRELSPYMSPSSLAGRFQQCDIEILRLAKKMIYEEHGSLIGVKLFLKDRVKETMEVAPETDVKTDVKRLFHEFSAVDALNTIKELRWKNIRPMTGEEPDAWISTPHYEVDGFLEIAGVCSIQRIRFTEDELQRILLGKVS